MNDFDISQLGAQIGSGGEAFVYDLKPSPGLVAKIYKQRNKVPVDKLSVLINRTIGLSGTVNSNVAWPLGFVKDKGVVAGYYMRKINFKSALCDVYNEKYRAVKFSNFGLEEINKVTLNLTIIVDDLHKLGYIIGDLNESNVLVDDSCNVFIVDVDSFQVVDNSNTYLCPVKKDEYLPPELQNVDIHRVVRTKSHDCFSLAVLIFLLKANGSHPFRGIGGPTMIPERIQQGLFPYGSLAKGKAPNVNYFEQMPKRIQSLFITCFHDGHTHPNKRPSANLWVAALSVSALSVGALSVRTSKFLPRFILVAIPVLCLFFLVLISGASKTSPEPLKNESPPLQQAEMNQTDTVTADLTSISPTRMPVIPETLKYATLKISLPPMPGKLIVNDQLFNVDGTIENIVYKDVLFQKATVHFQTENTDFFKSFDVNESVIEVDVIPLLKEKFIENAYEYDYVNSGGEIVLSNTGFTFISKKKGKILASKRWDQVRAIHFNYNNHAFIDVRGWNNFTMDNIFEPDIVAVLKSRNIEFVNCYISNCEKDHVNR